ncbi:tyrosine-type recombinase/integrase [Pseudomonas putida]|uniref:tyrosine-type recombinase/integrase n=1 Tax=Pseudomonas putida TaxID=303 RepID=UPI003709F0F2
MATHLIRKRGESTWYARIIIPADIRHSYNGQRTLTKTTGTSNRTEALERRWPIITAWKAEFRAIREGRAEDADKWREEVAGYSHQSATHLQNHLVSLFSGGRRLATAGEANLEWLNELGAEMDMLLQEGMTAEVHDFAVVMKDYLDAIGKGFSDKVEAAALSEKYTNASRKLATQILAKIYDLNPTETEEALEISHDPSKFKAKSPISTHVLDQFRTYLERQGKEPKTVDSIIRRTQLLSEHLEQSGHALCFDTISLYLDQLTDSKGTPLTTKTKKQHIWSGNSFWKWAMKYNAEWREKYKGAANPFEHHDLPVVKGESISWSVFSTKEVESLHSAAITKGDTSLADLIALAAYTGARVEEIGRVHRDTISLKDGVPIAFSILESKTEAGVREVPIHSAIAPLVLSLLDASEDGYILKGRPLGENNKYGHRLDAVGKRFGRLKTAAGFDSTYVLHSIRKTAITEVHRAGADVSVMPALFGHETGMITFDLYSAGPSLEQKRKVIELLSYKFKNL